MPEQEKVHVAFDIYGYRFREITEKMRSVGIDSLRDYFDNALTILDWAIEEVQKKKVVASVDEQKGSYNPLDMPILTKAKETREWSRNMTETLKGAQTTSFEAPASEKTNVLVASLLAEGWVYSIQPILIGNNLFPPSALYENPTEQDDQVRKSNFEMRQTFLHMLIKQS